jgi:hypothetical protein
MAIPVDELKGVTAEIAAALHAIGITDAAQLLAAAGQPKQREALAAALELPVCAVLELTNRADLTRIQGVVGVYVELLEYAGVDTVMELRRRVPETLYAKLVKVAAQRHVQRLPRLDEVQRWVLEAKQVERAVY